MGINAFKKGLKEEKGGPDSKDVETARLERSELGSTADRKETANS